ncbi:basic secretory family protein [Shimazuella sp. AN120528]|uniref:basic secretory family protein n=1 Tax=Shimazuella soli TaxID=1892854 RepID=UPI001F0FE9C4|nr:basic secretory family protein [Shimazuella soli]MCH5584365.1 basic secretory family protein [Shimazuella soli]
MWKNKGLFLVISFFFTFVIFASFDIPSVYATTKVVKNGDYKMTIAYDDDQLKDVVSRYETTFKRTYPPMADAYNPKKARKEFFVKFEKNKDYPIAYTLGNTIYIHPDYAKNNPDDQGMLVHEMCHILQAYPNGVKVPSWFVEGFADYARYRYSNLDNWRFPKVDKNQKYTDSYRVTARFFMWINHIKSPGSILKIHQRVQNNYYSDNLFEEYTGKTLDELWQEYQQKPGPVESLDWKIADNKARYNGETGVGTWVKYMEFFYIPGKQNYIHTRSNNATEGNVSYKIVDASTGKEVHAYTTSTLKQDSISSIEPLGKDSGEPAEGKYILYVQIPKGMNIDFEFNHGNKFY